MATRKKHQGLTYKARRKLHNPVGPYYVVYQLDPRTQKWVELFRHVRTKDEAKAIVAKRLQQFRGLRMRIVVEWP